MTDVNTKKESEVENKKKLFEETKDTESYKIFNESKLSQSETEKIFLLSNSDLFLIELLNWSLFFIISFSSYLNLDPSKQSLMISVDSCFRPSLSPYKRKNL